MLAPSLAKEYAITSPRPLQDVRWLIHQDGEWRLLVRVGGMDASKNEVKARTSAFLMLLQK